MIIESKYIITYSNHLFFEGRKLSFRKKELFDITNGVPRLIEKTFQGWWFKRKLLTLEKIKEILIYETVKIDVSSLQWYQQEKLNHVFNLI